MVGTPGQEYGIRVCNTTGERVLAVMSVDGVNVVSGETASPVAVGLRAERATSAPTSTAGARASPSTAAFYFTELPDAYATRTGRPDNVGVIGVAFFRERPQRIVWKDSPPKIAAEPRARIRARGRTPPRQRDSASSRASDAPAARGELAAGMRRAGAGGEDRHGPRPRRAVVRADDAASCARARRRTRRSRSTTTAARISSRWASCRRPRSPGRSIRFPRGTRGSCRIRRRVERASQVACHRLRGARAARILAGDARARHRRRDARRGPDARLCRGRRRGVRRALCAAQGRRVSLPAAPVRACRRRRRTLPGRVDERDPCARVVCAERQVHDVALSDRAPSPDRSLARDRARSSSSPPARTTTRTIRSTPFPPRATTSPKRAPARASCRAG